MKLVSRVQFVCARLVSHVQNWCPMCIRDTHASCAFHSQLSGVSCAVHECMKSHVMYTGHHSQWSPTYAFKPTSLMRWLVLHVHFMCFPFVYAKPMKCTWDTRLNDIPHMHLGPCADLCLMCSSCVFHSCLSGVSCAFYECLQSPWKAHEMHMGHPSQRHPTWDTSLTDILHMHRGRCTHLCRMFIGKAVFKRTLSPAISLLPCRIEMRSLVSHVHTHSIRVSLVSPVHFISWNWFLVCVCLSSHQVSFIWWKSVFHLMVECLSSHERVSLVSWNSFRMYISCVKDWSLMHIWHTPPYKAIKTRHPMGLRHPVHAHLTYTPL